MADGRLKHVGMFPLTTRQFSATFLDFQRNSRGYNDKVESADQDVTKRLLNPFLPEFKVFPIPQCHRFGNAMWAFAKECTAIQRQSTSQSTDLNLPASHSNSEEELKVIPSKVDELPRSSVLPFSSSKNEPTPTSCKIPEFVNEKELCTGPSKSDVIDAATRNGASKSKTTSSRTDQNQNTVVSEFSISQNTDYHFPDCLQQQSSGSCEELQNEALVNNKLSRTEAVSNRRSSHFENNIELANLEPGTMLSTDCHQQNGYEKRVDIDGGLESKDIDLFSGDEKCIKNEKNVKNEEFVASMLSVNDIENEDTTKGRHLCDVSISEKKKALKESFHTECHIMPLPFYKGGNYNSIPISASLTVNLNLEALLSFLRSEKKMVKYMYAEHDDGRIYGKVAILYGFQQNARVSVLQAEMVGLYDYISGTVYGLQQGLCYDDSESQDIKCPFSPSVVGLDLDAFPTQFHHITRALTPQPANGGDLLKEHSVVAWLLTSPALGVTLDWQVQEKLHKFVEILSTGEHSVQQQSPVSNDDCFSTQWYNLLVIIDEYRFVEKDIPLVEVYELCTSRDINLVNFDLN